MRFLILFSKILMIFVVAGMILSFLFGMSSCISSLSGKNETTEVAEVDAEEDYFASRVYELPPASVEEIDISPQPIGNGTILKQPVSDCLAPLEVSALDLANYYISLEPISGNLDDSISFFLGGGYSATVYVPLGEYTCNIAAGSIWYGEEKLFGEGTLFFYDVGTLNFYENGDSYSGWDLDIFISGNEERSPCLRLQVGFCGT